MEMEYSTANNSALHTCHAEKKKSHADFWHHYAAVLHCTDGKGLLECCTGVAHRPLKRYLRSLVKLGAGEE